MSLYKDASLVMIPSAYKDGKLYSIRPTDGSGDFTFSRGSNLAATRVDVNGLIEKGRENLLLQSNQFDTTWQLTNAPTLTSGQSGYDGSNDAWKLEASTTGSSRSIHQLVSTSGVQVFSVYVKAGTTSWIRLNLSGIGNRYFDIGNGVVGGSGSMDGFITDVGGGWYRCSVLGNGSSTAPYIFLASGNGNLAVSAGDNIYIQDAQLEAGLVATDYIETGASTAQAGILEDMPRLDYSGGASCPALLLEPQRTNDAAHSEYISAFNNLSAINVDDNVTTSPEGVNNAALIYADATSNQHYISNNHSYTSGTAFTISIFAKVRDYDYFFFRVQDFMSPSTTIFNLASGTLATAGSEDSYKIESLNDGWYRISVTYTPTSTAVNNNGLRLGFSPTAAYSYTGDNSSGGYVYGYQWEQGSYPTSYIPTYGSSVTRLKDTASLVGTDLLDQDNQTLFIEYTKGGIDGSANTIFSTSDGTSSANRMQIVDNNDDVYLYSNAGGTNILNNTNALLLANLETGDTIKVAVVMTATSIKAFANGVEKVNFTDSFSWSVTMDDLYMGARGGLSEPPKGQGVKQAVVFPTALTDSECIALTTL